MIQMTENLINKKAAYESKGHVYFSVSSFKDYGKLSNKNPNDLKAGARVEISKYKKSLWTLFFGSLQKKLNLVGTHPGGEVDQDGT